MKRVIKIIAIVIAILTVYSALPVIPLYLQKSPAIYNNKDAVQKLAGNKGDYFAFIVTSDTHSGLLFDDSSTLKAIGNMNREDRFKKIPIDFMAIAGDITFRGSAWDYIIFNKIRSRIKYPVICTIGNHDNDGNTENLFGKYVGQTRIAFADRNSYFIIFDDSLGNISPGDFKWLEEELKKSQNYQHRFIIIHKPSLSPYQQSWYRPELSPWAYKFMKLCEEYKVDIVFSGHEHMFKKRSYGGVKYVNAGGGGIPTNFPDSAGGFLNYIVIRVFGDYVDFEVRKITPPLWEILVYYMWKDLFYALKGLIL